MYLVWLVDESFQIPITNSLFSAKLMRISYVPKHQWNTCSHPSQLTLLLLSSLKNRCEWKYIKTTQTPHVTHKVIEAFCFLSACSCKGKEMISLSTQMKTSSSCLSTSSPLFFNWYASGLTPPPPPPYCSLYKSSSCVSCMTQPVCEKPLMGSYSSLDEEQ